MAEERDIWIEFVEKLNELTLKGVLGWTSTRPPETKLGDPNRLIPIAFEAEYKDRKLRLYEEKVNLGRPVLPYSFTHALKDWVDSLSGNTDRLVSEAVWRSYVVLELIDKTGVSWEFPNIAGLDDLLESVKFQVAGVNEYVEAVL